MSRIAKWTVAAWVVLSCAACARTSIGAEGGVAETRGSGAIPFVPGPPQKGVFGRFAITPLEAARIAKILVDGQSIRGDKAAFTPGKATHVVVIAEGYRPFDRMVTLDKDADIPIKLVKK